MKLSACVLSAIYSLVALFSMGGAIAEVPANLKTDQLAAWCIVPFDALSLIHI